MARQAREVQQIFESIRQGLVPERGLDAFAVGIERQRGEMHRQLDLAEAGGGAVKFLRGGYGCGKTFLARLALADAQARRFATSFVVVSDSDLHFHRFDDVYRKVVTGLSTAACPRGALGDLLDRWIARVEDALVEGGADEEAEDFDARVRERLAAELASLTRGAAPDDFVRVVQTIFELKQEGALAEAGALLSWLSGSGNVAAGAKRRAGVKGEIGSRDAMHFLRGIVEIIKAVDYRGLVIVIDEAETILRMRRDVRHRSLNGIRQICDAAGSYPGLLWVFTGTPEFFDSRRGVAGLEPLHQRVGFIEEGGYASLRQPQLELKPFDKPRLMDVALKLREIYPTAARERLEARITRDFVSRLVDQVSEGFRGKVGVVPRQFLRKFVHHLDAVDEQEGYDPAKAAGFEPTDLTDEERSVVAGRVGDGPVEANEDLVPVEDAW